MPAPLATCRSHDPGASSTPASGTAGRESMPIPSHSRYTAPAAVSTASTSGDRATSAPTPAATTAVAAKCPASSPPTAGSTTRCRSPAAIAYAHSAPGVTTNRNDTAQNAATAPPATTLPFAPHEPARHWLIEKND
jgi:hypothetical protein